MSLVDHDSWDIEYEGCERLRHQLLVQLNERRQLQSSPTSREYVKLTNSIESGLEQLRKDVNRLKVVLNNAITWETSPETELQQRRISFDKLTSQLREIELKFTSSTRANQLATSSGSVWQNAGATAAAATPGRPTDVESLKRMQAEILEEQNRGLEALSRTIGRQRDMAIVVGNEVETQNTILDNLSNTMDRVDNGLQRETQGIGQINRTDSTWGYWLVIIGLFIAIIVTILL
ncbi:syntaxin-8 [Drosophila innubila]|uniref:syntaxin-8 n=1 Tax=Drosophila innubila TaxID=198719 RepID=UPI00148D7EB9|nr:syntaxin-8 [Drosophila innubila]